MSQGRGSNSRPVVYDTTALPTELPWQKYTEAVDQETRKSDWSQISFVVTQEIFDPSLYVFSTEKTLLRFSILTRVQSSLHTQQHPPLHYGSR